MSRKLDHKNVIKYVGAGALAEKVFVALELATDGCLAHFLSTKYQLCLSETAQKLPSEGYDQAERWSWKAGIRRWGSSHNRAVLLSGAFELSLSVISCICLSALHQCSWASHGEWPICMSAAFCIEI